MDASQENTILRAVLNLSSKFDTLEKKVDDFKTDFEEETKKNENAFNFLNYKIDSSFSFLNSKIDKTSEENEDIKNEIQGLKLDLNKISFTLSDVQSKQYEMINKLNQVN